MTDRFEEWSEERHRRHFEAFARGGEKAELARAWMDEGTADAWRHHRMLALADPLIEACPGAEWLTVGDGQYGGDAHYLASRGASVLATDVTDTLLAEAKDAGYISRYARENVESLSFADASFDFVLCKESYHHFPRPPLALYEMLRVARRGVLLIEPNDPARPTRIREILFQRAKDGLKRLLGRDVARHQFEDSGNYVFALSRWELEKLALAIHRRHLAFRGLNDSWLPGLDRERAGEGGPALRRLRRRLARYDLLVRLGLMQPVILGAIVFKSEPGAEVRAALAGAGWDVVDLPANPYYPGDSD